MSRDEDLESRLDPQLREIFRVLPPIAIGREVVQRERVELSDALREVERPPGFSDRFIPGLEHDPLVRLRSYRPPAASGRLPALIWLHGGGWTLGVPEVDERMLQEFADQVALQIVSVDYRLAPEHPFPAALRDAEAALRWTFEHSAELQVDPEQLFVGGSSAGANLAAGLCVKLRDGAQPNPAFQLLLYPALDDRLDTPSMHEIADRRTIHREFLRDCWRSYLGSAVPNPYSSPARAEELSGLAPALIIAAELDPLRDEAVRHAVRLWQAAVRCELHVLQGAIHGVDALARTSALARLVTGLARDGLSRALR